VRFVKLAGRFAGSQVYVLARQYGDGALLAGDGGATGVDIVARLHGKIALSLDRAHFGATRVRAPVLAVPDDVAVLVLRHRAAGDPLRRCSKQGLRKEWEEEADKWCHECPFRKSLASGDGIVGKSGVGGWHEKRRGLQSFTPTYAGWPEVGKRKTDSRQDRLTI